MNFSSFFCKRLLSLIGAIVYSICINSVYAQETDHPTISKLTVSYSQDPNSDFVPDSVIKVRPNAQIELNVSAMASSIHLKIKNEAGDVLLYEVSYSVGETPVTNDDGLTVYQKDGNTIIIKAPDYIALTSYKYEVTTEDGDAVASPVYSSVQ